MLAGLRLQARLQIADGHRLPVPAQLAGRIQAQLDRRWWLRAINHAIGGLRQLHVDRPRQHRRGHDEDDQQHQHHIHQWRDVDVRQWAASSCATECHVPLPAAGPVAPAQTYAGQPPSRQCGSPRHSAVVALCCRVRNEKLNSATARYAGRHDPTIFDRPVPAPAGHHAADRLRECPVPRCPERPAEGRHRGRRTWPVRSRPGRRAQPPSSVWLAGVRQPAAQHRHRGYGAGTGLPQALPGPGRGQQLPQRLAALRGAPAGLADAAGQLGADRQPRPALCAADGAAGHRQGGPAVDWRGTGSVAQERQVTA
ncbi:hypothetical protein D3C72_1305960 [compost metagenome]